MQHLKVENSINLIMADRHPLILEGIKILFAGKGKKKPWNLTTTRQLDLGLVDVALAQKPALLMIGLAYTDNNLITLIKSLKNTVPETRVLILGSITDARFMRMAFKAGADGYILKSENPSELLNAIERILAGEVYIGKGLNLFETPPGAAKSHAAAARPTEVSDFGLTNREKEVFMCIGEALNPTQIGEKLGISPLTVNIHRKNIMNKMKVKNVSELVKIFYENQLFVTM
ncbi:MAG: response regulator transcription factor [Saprospiraceae bacterium]|nr:response regulator transcription factor [Saprospiraceae bacterium]